MNEDNKEVKRTIVDDVEIIEDGNTTYFRPVKHEEQLVQSSKNKSWFDKIIDYFKDEDTVKPYVKFRNLNEPVKELEKADFIDSRTDSESRPAVEVGIKFKF